MSNDKLARMHWGGTRNGLWSIGRPGSGARARSARNFIMWSTSRRRCWRLPGSHPFRFVSGRKDEGTVHAQSL